MVATEGPETAAFKMPPGSISLRNDEGTVAQDEEAAHNEDGEISNYLEGWPLRATTMAYDSLSALGLEHCLINSFC